jgi:hypothetical protein
VRCIFCLEEKPGSEEHVFPLGIGGCLTTTRVCVSCNSKIGSRVDAPLIDHTLIVLRRAELGIAGRGDVPNAFEYLFGDVVLATDQSQRLRTTIDPKTGKLDIYLIPSSSPPQQLNAGTTVKRLVVDARDIHKLGTIAQKIRQRHNCPPLSDQEIERLVLDAQQNINTTENPDVLAVLKFDTHRFMGAILKICYELAFLWFGEKYLEDPVAAKVRRYLKRIMDGGFPSNEEEFPMQGTITNEVIAPMAVWAENKNLHLAFAIVVPNHLGICVKIFDIFYAVLFVTDDAGKYVSGAMSDRRLRFLVIDPVVRIMEETALRDEFGRIAGIMTGRITPR